MYKLFQIACIDQALSIFCQDPEAFETRNIPALVAPENTGYNFPSGELLLPGAVMKTDEFYDCRQEGAGR